MNERKTRIYIAGPYTKPDPCINTSRAIKVADQLLALGYVPFVPHLTHFWHTMSPRPYEDWMSYDREWLRACDALLRLDGESSGADREIADAEQWGIPVFRRLSDLCSTIRAQQPITITEGEG